MTLHPYKATGKMVICQGYQSNDGSLLSSLFLSSFREFEKPLNGLSESDLRKWTPSLWSKEKG